MPDDRRDQRETIKPPPAVREQIAGPLKKPRAATPVEFAAIEFEREPTAVTSIPKRIETPEQRARRHAAESVNMNIEQLDELAWLRRHLTTILEDQQKSREAWRTFWVRFGAAVILAATALAGLIKLSGCGD